MDAKNIWGHVDEKNASWWARTSGVCVCVCVCVCVAHTSGVCEGSSECERVTESVCEGRVKECV